MPAPLPPAPDSQPLTEWWAAAWAETKELAKFCFPLLLLWLGRRLGRGDKAKEKQAQVEADAAADIKALKLAADVNVTQHSNFQREIEKIADLLAKNEAATQATTALAARNESRLEGTKEALARVEGSLAGFIQTLLKH